jgi:23S rRNA (adenine2030-N6)-methyltransferase
MLSYQHGYHAGCFADVVKHVTLTRLLHYLTQKEKPLLYLETHSGRGRYDLQDAQALKTGEARFGIEPLWAKRDELPPIFLPYLQAIHQLNPDGALRYYPGSPDFAIHALRPYDRLNLCELHPTEFDHLSQLPHPGRRVFFNNQDGFDALKSALPPIERRGLIFIDPSYEVKTEYRWVIQALEAAYRRFATGVYCLWYPFIDKRVHEQLIRGLSSMGVKSYLQVEFYLTSTAPVGMSGCGLWIINPPYSLADELTIALQALCRVLNPGKSSYVVETSPNPQ